jgi:hypothetical protein
LTGSSAWSAKLESAARRHAEFPERQQQRFRPLQLLLEELGASVDGRFEFPKTTGLLEAETLISLEMPAALSPRVKERIDEVAIIIPSGEASYHDPVHEGES